MTQEAHDIVEELKKFNAQPKGGAVWETNTAMSFLAFRTARLQVLIAEDQLRSAAKVERQTDKLITLTWAIVGLTAVLLLFTAYLSYDIYQHRQHGQLNHESTTDKR